MKYAESPNEFFTVYPYLEPIMESSEGIDWLFLLCSRFENIGEKHNFGISYLFNGNPYNDN